MSLTKIIDDIADRRDWVDPENRNADLTIAFAVVAFITVAGASVVGVFDKNKNGQNLAQVEQLKKMPNEPAQAYHNLSRE